MGDYLIIIFMLVQAWVNVRFAYLLRDNQEDNIENRERIRELHRSHEDNYNRIIRVMDIIADTERRIMNKENSNGRN